MYSLAWNTIMCSAVFAFMNGNFAWKHSDMVPLLPRTTQHKFPDAEIAKTLSEQGTLP